MKYCYFTTAKIESWGSERKVTMTSYRSPLTAWPRLGWPSAGDFLGPELAPPTPFLRKPLLTLPGTGLLDQALPLRLVGHLDEPVLAALRQHLLHGGCGNTGAGAERGAAASGVAAGG